MFTEGVKGHRLQLKCYACSSLPCRPVTSTSALISALVVCSNWASTSISELSWSDELFFLSLSSNSPTSISAVNSSCGREQRQGNSGTLSSMFKGNHLFREHSPRVSWRSYAALEQRFPPVAPSDLSGFQQC